MSVALVLISKKQLIKDSGLSKPRKAVRNSAAQVERIPQENGSKLVASAFQGPLPPPAILEDYDRIQPGLAAEIVRWATDETAHRHAMEKKAISIDEKLAGSHVREVFLGQLFGFLIAMSFLAAAVYLAVIGKEIAASALGTLGIGSIVAAFLVGRNRSGSKVAKK